MHPTENDRNRSRATLASRRCHLRTKSSFSALATWHRKSPASKINSIPMAGLKHPSMIARYAGLAHCRLSCDTSFRAAFVCFFSGSGCSNEKRKGTQAAQGVRCIPLPSTSPPPTPTDRPPPRLRFLRSQAHGLRRRREETREFGFDPVRNILALMKRSVIHGHGTTI